MSISVRTGRNYALAYVRPRQVPGQGRTHTSIPSQDDAIYEQPDYSESTDNLLIRLNDQLRSKIRRTINFDHPFFTNPSLQRADREHRVRWVLEAPFLEYDKSEPSGLLEDALTTLTPVVVNLSHPFFDDARVPRNDDERRWLSIRDAPYVELEGPGLAISDAIEKEIRTRPQCRCYWERVVESLEAGSHPNSVSTAQGSTDSMPQPAPEEARSQASHQDSGQAGLCEVKNTAGTSYEPLKKANSSTDDNQPSDQDSNSGWTSLDYDGFVVDPGDTPTSSGGKGKGIAATDESVEDDRANVETEMEELENLLSAQELIPKGENLANDDEDVEMLRAKIEKLENLLATLNSKKTQGRKSIHVKTMKNEETEEFLRDAFGSGAAPSAHKETSETEESTGPVEEPEVNRLLEREIIMAERRARQYRRTTRVPGTENRYHYYYNFYVR